MSNYTKRVRWPGGFLNWSLPNRKMDVPAGCAPAVVALMIGYMVLGGMAFAAWRLSNDVGWVVEFLRAPAALVSIGLAALGFLLSVSVTRHFAPGESLRPAWILIACSAACDLSGLVCSQALGVDSLLNPLTHVRGAAAAINVCRAIGPVLGGPLRFALLAIALDFALKAYRRAGFLGRLSWTDWALLAGLGVYELHIVSEVVAAVTGGKEPAIKEVLSWPVDPLLWLLLAEALQILRSVKKMGDGSIGRCWGAFSAGIILTSLGNIELWAAKYGYLAWSWSSLAWSLWLPAAVAFALAPAYQLEAIRQATTGRKPG